MKITAFGDLHLDSAFSAFGLRESSKRREMLRNIFSNIISLVKENQKNGITHIVYKKQRKIPAFD